jgi:hypothetical protein
VILHTFKIGYYLGHIKQCYLPGKMADNMHSQKQVVMALFLHSPPHNWVRKCFDFLPFINKLPLKAITVKYVPAQSAVEMPIFLVTKAIKHTN